jgi:hypothetical protein
VGNSEGKSLLGKPRHRCIDDIKIDLGDIGWVVGRVLNAMVWLKIGNSGEIP